MEKKIYPVNNQPPTIGLYFVKVKLDVLTIKPEEQIHTFFTVNTSMTVGDKVLVKTPSGYQLGDFVKYTLEKGDAESWAVATVRPELLDQMVKELTGKFYKEIKNHGKKAG